MCFQLNFFRLCWCLSLQNCNIHGATLWGFPVLISALRTSPTALLAVNDTSGPLLFLDFSSAHLRLQNQLSFLWPCVFEGANKMQNYGTLCRTPPILPGPKCPSSHREVGGQALSQDTSTSKLAKTSLLLHREGINPTKVDRNRVKADAS